jgi:hypothetical protein
MALYQTPKLTIGSSPILEPRLKSKRARSSSVYRASESEVDRTCHRPPRSVAVDPKTTLAGEIHRPIANVDQRARAREHRLGIAKEDAASVCGATSADIGGIEQSSWSGGDDAGITCV